MNGNAHGVDASTVEGLLSGVSVLSDADISKKREERERRVGSESLAGEREAQ